MDESVLEFLVQSNAIEGEHSTQAAVDSIRSWKYAIRNLENIDIEVVKGIHYHLIKRINPMIAGKIRKVHVYVGDERCMEPEKIYEALEKWCHKYNQDETWDSIKERSIEFMKIHPFEDGNGRTGRILMNLQRIKANMPLLVIHQGIEQVEYYKWFN